MLGIDRRVLQTVWTVFLSVSALAALYEIRRTLVLFALALFLANLLSPVVERVHWLIPLVRHRARADRRLPWFIWRSSESWSPWPFPSEPRLPRKPRGSAALFQQSLKQIR